MVPVVPPNALPEHADVIVECAPAAAFRAIAEPAVRSGKTLLAVSVGGLHQHPDIIDLAAAHGATIIVPSGAVLGLDGVSNRTGVLLGGARVYLGLSAGLVVATLGSLSAQGYGSLTFAVPNDPRSPFVTSGLRLGTPAITTRGFGPDEVTRIAGWIADILDDIEDESRVDAIREQVIELCRRFPVYKKRS